MTCHGAVELVLLAGREIQSGLGRDGAYLLRSNQSGWTAEEFWETYIQLTVVERAFRVLKSELLLRPVWHQYSGRTKAMCWSACWLMRCGRPWTTWPNKPNCKP